VFPERCTEGCYRVRYLNRTRPVRDESYTELIGASWCRNDAIPVHVAGRIMKLRIEDMSLDSYAYRNSWFGLRML
jgi:hypothetical protein